ncbi:tartronate semialdehyde reductase [Yersinia aldovae ATCC 35236]|nr:tartronate semialdehyde reductase [Yersinia aldovae ATCC 35236]
MTIGALASNTVLPALCEYLQQLIHPVPQRYDQRQLMSNPLSADFYLLVFP